ncbi:MAG: isochorismatase [Paenibacillaceae bacterium]|nr:MAG: isochorismatase [Paenibacillaceae bacterium]
MHVLGNRRRHWLVSKDHVDMTAAGSKPKRITLEAEPQRITVDLARTAIIVVDMQNDFCSAGGWLDHIGVDYTPAREPIEPLNRLLPALRSEDVPVIWLNWGNRPDLLNISPSLLHVYNMTGDDVGLGGILPATGSAVLEKDSWGAAVVDELVIEPSDIRVDKYRMSGFWDTPLDSILRNLGIDTLLFAGVNLDQCVMTTLQDAVCLGYNGVLLRDCSATTSPDFCREAALYNIKQCFGFVSSGGAILSALRAG